MSNECAKKVNDLKLNKEDFPTIEAHVGNTPLVRLQRLPGNTSNIIMAKLEGNNPAGSVKDRPALSMIKHAEARGDIKPGDTLIEATSGNTGIALAMVAAIKGYKMILIMPEHMSQERRAVMKAFGAEIILTPEAGSMEAAIDLSREMEADKKGIVLDQFSNQDNPLAHYEGTGPEIWRDTHGKITHFVSSMGTTGTIMGTSRYLKEQNPEIQIIGVQPVDGVSYALKSGETLGVVGESGCGKSVSALSILRLVANPPGRIVGGSIEFEGRNLLEVSETEMERIRGNEISMIFQEPMTSLNPLFTVGRQVSEAIALHQGLSRREAMDRAVEMLRQVYIPEPERRVHAYPHQLSGGMRQRVMIAMALSCNPKVLIADEPTTALDVTIQAQILELMRELQKTFGTAIVLITHDMGVVAENADRVVVMYAGRKVEEAPAADLFDNPGHPYTRGLLGSIPHLDTAAQSDGSRARLTEIKGMVPSLFDLPPGCSFAPRCGFATDRCRGESPVLAELRPGHWVACWHADRLLGGAA